MNSLRSYIRLLRPRQWLKNLMIYFPPFLGGTLLQPGIANHGTVPFVAFCLVSSATYIVNDVVDAPHDCHHPEKCTRPIPSGTLSISTALLLASFLAFVGVGLAYSVSLSFLILLCLYLLISVAYSLRLKHIVLLDIFCISAGFLLRLQAGGAVFGINLSEWLFLSVFLLSVFLSTGKRFSEKIRLGPAATNHRTVLDSYPQEFLEGIMYMTGGAVLVTYTMYVIARHSNLLLYTVPLCCFGLMRYLLRVKSGGGGDPTDSLLKDTSLLIVSFVWAVMVGWGVYGE